jgi:hypothetical protein
MQFGGANSKDKGAYVRIVVTGSLAYDYIMNFPGISRSISWRRKFIR